MLLLRVIQETVPRSSFSSSKAAVRESQCPKHPPAGAWQFAVLLLGQNRRLWLVLQTQSLPFFTSQVISFPLWPPVLSFADGSAGGCLGLKEDVQGPLQLALPLEKCHVEDVRGAFSEDLISLRSVPGRTRSPPLASALRLRMPITSG